METDGGYCLEWGSDPWVSLSVAADWLRGEWGGAMGACMGLLWMETDGGDGLGVGQRSVGVGIGGFPLAGLRVGWIDGPTGQLAACACGLFFFYCFNLFLVFLVKVKLRGERARAQYGRRDMVKTQIWKYRSLGAPLKMVNIQI